MSELVEVNHDNFTNAGIAMSHESEELSELRTRILELESQVRTIKTGLGIGCICLVLLLIPGINSFAAVAIYAFIIISAVLAFIYFVMWICDRCFGKPLDDKTSQVSNTSVQS